MYTDASGAGNVCISVPADQIEGGSWTVSEWFSDPVFVGLD